MKTFLFGILLLTFSSAFADRIPLPENWTSDFRIDLSSSGGMMPSTSSVAFTYDSCKYISTAGSKTKIIAFKLNLQQRAEILKQMHVFKVGEIREDFSVGATLDKGNTSFCYKTSAGTQCYSDSGASEINEADRDNFHDAYNYLCNFALSKGKMKK